MPVKSLILNEIFSIWEERINNSNAIILIQGTSKIISCFFYSPHMSRGDISCCTNYGKLFHPFIFNFICRMELAQQKKSSACVLKYFSFCHSRFIIPKLAVSVSFKELITTHCNVLLFCVASKVGKNQSENSIPLQTLPIQLILFNFQGF